MASYQMTAEAVGKILMAQRTNTGASQRTIAELLGYKNVNFISMIENGRSSIPMGKIVEIVNAYCLPMKFSVAILAVYYPDLLLVVKGLLDVDGIRETLKLKGEEFENRIVEIVNEAAKIADVIF